MNFDEFFYFNLENKHSTGFATSSFDTMIEQLEGKKSELTNSKVPAPGEFGPQQVVRILETILPNIVSNSPHTKEKIPECPVIIFTLSHKSVNVSFLRFVSISSNHQQKEET